MAWELLKNRILAVDRGRLGGSVGTVSAFGSARVGLLLSKELASPSPCPLSHYLPVSQRNILKKTSAAGYVGRVDSRQGRVGGGAVAGFQRNWSPLPMVPESSAEM